jgi:hypothetical protein
MCWEWIALFEPVCERRGLVELRMHKAGRSAPSARDAFWADGCKTGIGLGDALRA